MPAPIFEVTTSPLTRSNDGRLMAVRVHLEADPYLAFDVLDLANPGSDRAVIRTHRREVSDAYIAGYDLAAANDKRR